MALGLPLVSLNLLFSLVSKSFLIKSLAGIHAFGTVENKLVNIIYGSVILWNETICSVVIFNQFELVVGLLLVLHDVLDWTRFIAVYLMVIIDQVNL